jgi:hypothetical protein
VKDLPVFHLLDEALLQIADDAVGDAPLDEVQLGYGRRQALELDAGRPAEGIEELLGVAVETRLVRDVDREHLAIRCRVGHVLILRIVRDEPFQFTE